VQMGLFKNTVAVGMTIGTELVRVVCLEKTSKGLPLLIAKGAAKIPSDAVLDGVVQQLEPVTQAIQDLWLQTGIKERTVILGISNQSVFLKQISLPQMPKSKIAGALHWQAANYLPAPIEDLSYDFQILGEKETAQQRILLAAVKRNSLENNLQAVQRANLTVQAVEINQLSLLRLIPPKLQSASFLLADIADETAVLLLAEYGTPYLLKTFPQLTSDPEQLLKAINSLLTEQQPYNTVDVILLCGQSAHLTGLYEYLKQNIRIAVRIINPLSFLQINAIKSTLYKDEQFQYTDFATTVALALRG